MLPYYYSLNEYLLDKYNKKIYKLSLNGGMTCPNRDGSLDTRGCIFCSSGGSGEFAGDNLGSCTSITEQIENGITLLSKKYSGDSFIAYFQSFTNTYAPVSYLKNIYLEAARHPKIECLSIATRPDCIDKSVITLLEEISEIKPVWIELGLQTIHKNTADYIRRGYDLEVFEDAIRNLRKSNRHFHIVAHMIIGLPGESTQDVIHTAQYLARSPIDGIKLQLLHVLRGTDLAGEYERKVFRTLSLEEYVNILGEIITLLPKEMVIHRLTGDGPKNLLISPLWSSDKKKVLNRINLYFREKNIMQGSGKL